MLDSFDKTFIAETIQILYQCFGYKTPERDKLINNYIKQWD